MPMYGANASGNLRVGLRNAKTLTGAGVPLPAALSGSLGRWDAYSGIVADTTNGGFKWNPETGSSVLQTVSGTGPDYSATGLSSRPAMLLSTGKSLVGSPAINVNNVNQYFFMVLQMAAPAANGIVIGNSVNSALLFRVISDGSISIERQNNAGISVAPAGSFPFNVPVLLFYGHDNGATIKHRLRINKLPIAITNDTTGGAYQITANSMQIGRPTSSSSTDLNAAVSFFNPGTNAAPYGTTLTDYETAVYNRWVA